MQPEIDIREIRIMLLGVNSMPCPRVLLLHPDADALHVQRSKKKGCSVTQHSSSDVQWPHHVDIIAIYEFKLDAKHTKALLSALFLLFFTKIKFHQILSDAPQLVEACQDFNVRSSKINWVKFLYDDEYPCPGLVQLLLSLLLAKGLFLDWIRDGHRTKRRGADKDSDQSRIVGWSSIDMWFSPNSFSYRGSYFK